MGRWRSPGCFGPEWRDRSARCGKLCTGCPYSMARSAWPIELHSGEKPRLEWLLDDYYDIAYDYFVPVKGEGLLVAGRCLSAEHEAMASARVTAQCFPTARRSAWRPPCACTKKRSPRTLNVSRSARCTAQGRRRDLTCQKWPACARVWSRPIPAPLNLRSRPTGWRFSARSRRLPTGRASHPTPCRSATRRGGMAVYGITVDCDQVAADRPAHVALRDRGRTCGGSLGIEPVAALRDLTEPQIPP